MRSPDLRVLSVGEPVPTPDGFSVEVTVSADVRSVRLVAARSATMEAPLYGSESMENPNMVASLEGPPTPSRQQRTVTLLIGFLQPGTSYWWQAEMRGGLNSMVVERSPAYPAATADA